jgi:hypothetical protein
MLSGSGSGAIFSNIQIGVAVNGNLGENLV